MMDFINVGRETSDNNPCSLEPNTNRLPYTTSEELVTKIRSHLPLTAQIFLLSRDAATHMRKLPIMRKSRTDESSSVSKKERGVYLCSVSTKAAGGGLGLSVS